MEEDQSNNEEAAKSDQADELTKTPVALEEVEETKKVEQEVRFDLEPEIVPREPEEPSLSEESPKHELASNTQDVVTEGFNINNNTQNNKSFQTAAGDSVLSQSFTSTNNMEFTKNYSDDLLMGQNDGGQSAEMATGGADLADFELPPCSGSSSGSEPRQPSPTKRKSSTSTAITTAAATQAASSSHLVSAAAPDLTAVKNLLLSSYLKVSHVFHWKNPIESGVFFSLGASLIIALTFFSIISVVAYTALGVILTSGAIRIYKALMKTLNRSPETPIDHIWNQIQGLNVSMPPERLHQLVDSSHSNLNASLVYFKQVLLVQDKLATFKFGAFLYMLTYIGAWFNGLTIITICYLALFSMPIFYEKNKAKIDEYLNMATGQLSSVVSMVSGKVTALAFGGSGQTGSKKQD